MPATALWLPALLIPQLFLTAGLCWFLAALGVFVRDLTQIIGFLLNLIFFLTPILYPETALPESARKILTINPVYILVSGYRAIFLENRAPDATSLIALWAGSIALAACGYLWFRRMRRGFADVI